ncbi:hypothetical protein CERSUDRAFT_116139 [Gelatoporia subvermispora B]|uniref:Uncharacterized protein n=1 Tax=Ceriporiopsis subvermispora (strain B) TaxID=914234 RepID=M2R9B0_CERS8|nr:hypothetical protein CERSUDRAFT_116139 [Gelatoporia subvermispora B]
MVRNSRGVVTRPGWKAKAALETNTARGEMNVGWGFKIRTKMFGTHPPWLGFDQQVGRHSRRSHHHRTWGRSIGKDRKSIVGREGRGIGGGTL